MTARRLVRHLRRLPSTSWAIVVSFGLMAAPRHAVAYPTGGAQAGAQGSGGTERRTTPCFSPCLAQPPGIVAWYPLDEIASSQNAIDLIHRNDGVVHGNVPATDGIVDGARAFPTLADYLEAPDEAPLDMGTGNFSGCAWIRIDHFDNSGGVHDVLDKRDFAHMPFTQGYAFYVTSGALAVQVLDGATAPVAIAGGPNVTGGTWHHVGFTVNRSAADGVKLFVDGVQVASGDPRPWPGDVGTTASLRIGGGGSAPGIVAFDGAIDELEIFDRELAPAEMQAIYAAGSSGECRTNVVSAPTRSLPARTAFRTVAPNPSARGARIDFEIARREEVRLVVFTVTGARVRTLVSGIQEPGAKSATWDGRRDGGDRAGPGVYFVKLITRDGSLARKLVLLR